MKPKPSVIENKKGEDNFREGDLKAVSSKLHKHCIQGNLKWEESIVNSELLIFLSTSIDKYSTMDYEDWL